MQTIYDNWSMWQRLLTMLQNQFGDRSEFVLHDLTKDYSHTIVDIRNGHITNRSVGDCGSNLGLEVLRGTIQDGDRYNYIVNMRDGKLLRSSTMYIRNDAGAVIGSLCINSDITETVQLENFLHRYNKYELPSAPAAAEGAYPSGAPAGAAPQPAGPARQTELFANNVSQLLDFLMAEADSLVNKPVDAMTRADKMEYIRYLDQKGAFLITKSAEKVYEHLHISRFTFYNYLDAVRKETEGGGST